LIEGIFKLSSDSDERPALTLWQETAQTQTQQSWEPLIYAYVTLIQHDAISHTDVGFARSLTRIPVI